MKARLPFRLFVGALIVLVAATLVSAITAANTVPTSRVGNPTRAITLNDLKPAQCAAITLTSLVTGSGTFEGNNGNNLILGSSGVDDIRGRDGNDCIVAGAGGDDLDGDEGTDVCIGGPGSDSFDDCETQL